MTYQNDFTLPSELLEQIASEGLDFLPELVRILINAATQIDREKYLGAGHLLVLRLVAIHKRFIFDISSTTEYDM